MTDEIIKQATCKVINVHEVGTGWLVTPTLVLTAFHCVDAAVESGDTLTVQFGTGAASAQCTAELHAQNEELDVCLLRLPEAVQVEPLTINTKLPRPGEKWSAFGYAVPKLDLGHALNGLIQQTLDELTHGVDLDLSVSPETHLTNYSGLSGAALVVEGECRGLLRVSLDTAVGAISSFQLRSFLESNGVLNEDEEDVTPGEVFGTRPEFDQMFAERLTSLQHGYLLLEGAHGIGKSTFCKQYEPVSESVEVLGVYALSERGRGITSAHQAQPEVFYDWVNTLWSNEVSGKPARLQELSYPELIWASHRRIHDLANRCAAAGKVGLIFIDGLNEAIGAGSEAIQRLVALLPPSVPSGLIIVVTGAGLTAHAASIGPVLQAAARLTLPALEADSQRELCIDLLDQEFATASLVSLLCDRAKGHPLYLRYLADLANNSASEAEIAQMPAFSGSIRDYYESLWGQLLPDQDAINLLGILARLRWGVPTKDLTVMLQPAESAVYVPTLSRIRHLLSEADSTEIYHSSFSEFVEYKTSTVNESLHERLAAFCCMAQSGDYGQLNRVHHGLLGGAGAQLQAIEQCQQAWVDTSVTLGAVPDVLLGDIESTLAAATRIGLAQDTIRLLLLSQRLTFRYGILFAQAAELVAQALCAMGQTDQALRHVIRNGRLIAAPLEAYAVAHVLIRMGNVEQAALLLDKVQQSLDSVFEEFEATGSIDSGLLVRTLMTRLHGFALEHAVGRRPPVQQLLAMAIRQFRSAPEVFDEDDLADIISSMAGSFYGASLCVSGLYTSVAQLPLTAAPADSLLSILLGTLTHAQASTQIHQMRLPSSVVALLLKDLEEVSERLERPAELRFVVLNTLIETGASSDLIRRCGGADVAQPPPLVLYSSNRAQPDIQGFQDSYELWRAAAFFDEGQAQPTIPADPNNNWEAWLVALAAAVAWADGTARRAKANADEVTLGRVWAFLSDQVLPVTTRPLSVRIQWQEAYAIPEAIFPPIFQRLAKLLLECLPQEACRLINLLDSGFSDQLGLYNEGFRQTLALIVQEFVTAELEPATEDALFELVLRWRDYVQANVENRYELIPELLSIVPLLVHLDAQEEAARTYQAVLRCSMGPSWYKEDQLSLMSSALGALPADTPIPTGSLVQIASYLERASGEMTFQRYVRADKGIFIGQLCRRSLYSQAVDYFKHQACGTLSQLYGQAIAGGLDRVAPLSGMHFPGGALEEQAALLALLEEVPADVDWRLRWALLEVFLNGDDRHLPDWGKQFARLIGSMSEGTDELVWAERRTCIISQGMNPERGHSLLKGLVSSLPATHKPAFEELYESIEGPTALDLFEQVVADSAPSSLTEESSPVDSETTPKAERPGAKSVEEMLNHPGVFGSLSVDEQARLDLQSAAALKRRGNTSAAVQAAVNVLRTLQEGGWSIWTSNHTGSPAEEMIQTEVQEADAVARLYGPLALEERHTPRWLIASHLIDKVACKLDAEQQSALLEIAIEHVGHMVGQASTQGFDYLGGSTASASEALFDLLLWSLDHPSWERRDSAAAMLLWLVSHRDDYLAQLARLAFSMFPQNQSDLAAAVLDILSRRNPVELWERLASHVAIGKALSDCKHVSRLAILSRIVDRAAGKNSATAKVAQEALDEALKDDGSLLSVEEVDPPEYFPRVLQSQWQELAKQGLITPAMRGKADEALAQACLPLTTDIVQLLEERVAENFRQQVNFPTGRWASMGRFALNTALYRPMRREDLYAIEDALRIYNPNSCSTPKNAPQLLSGLIAALKNGSLQGFRPKSQDLVFLDVQCVIELNGEATFVELLAHLRSHDPRQPLYQSYVGFTANQVAPEPPDGQMAICVRAEPTSAYFASLTPAVPSHKFLQLIGCSKSATVRYHWRDGSIVTRGANSRGGEAVMLAIHKGALTLPRGWDLGWELRLNGRTMATMGS
ncbi:AVAST type 1 anti-phage system protease Avs1b [Halopseudomonas pelagia]|uniref:AVAST type 1 anti-phage system protease Avs1b n=1 Tax=Halopseudomonas pelagia TaxID=553151 RepID=UPI0030DB9C9F|tara:strand:+ start:24578 stop:30382 length:5805 start_codon:yes stop_codon:yes gene_type:complete